MKGLKERIDNLTALAKDKKEASEAVRTRATELDELPKDYRQGLEDFKGAWERKLTNAVPNLSNESEDEEQSQRRRISD